MFIAQLILIQLFFFDILQFYSEDTKKEIFANFWEKVSWNQRKLILSSLHISISLPNRKTTEIDTSRRDNTLLKAMKAVKFCGNTFLNTLRAGRAMAES